MCFLFIQLIFHKWPTLFLLDVDCGMYSLCFACFNRLVCRNCWQNYVDYYRCLKVKGEKYTLCDYFKKTFTTLCPEEWVSSCVD